MNEDAKLKGLCKECTHRNSCKDAKRYLEMTSCSNYRKWKKKVVKGAFMNKTHIFLDINEASGVVMKFIGSEKFDEVVKCIDDNAKSGFIAGLSFALCLAMAECKTYQYYVDEDPDK